MTYSGEVTAGDPEEPGTFGSLRGLELGGRLGPFELGVDLITSPAEPGRPLVVGGRELVHKIYDCEQLTPAARRRVEREAAEAIELSELEGVVVTHRAEQVDRWFVLEMDRAGTSLGQHLIELADSPECPSAEQYAEWLAQAAATLRRIHRAGTVHRDVKPDNILFSRDGTRVLIADFSVVKIKSSDFTAADAVPGTARFIAPESRRGETTPLSDQYALAVTARDLLTAPGSPPLTDPVLKVLRRATAHEPDERFEDISAFGDALRRAVKDDPPRTFAERVAAVPAVWRYTWAPAALAVFGFYVQAFRERSDSQLPYIETLLPPVIAGVLVALFVRLTSSSRARRTHSAHPLLDAVWFPLIPAAAVAVPWAIIDQENAATIVTIALIASYVLLARVGAFPPRTGHWIVRFARAAGATPLRRFRALGIAGLMLVALVLLPLGPALAQTLWPREGTTSGLGTPSRFGGARP